MATFSRWASNLYRGYLFSNLTKDVGRVVARNLGDLELDPDHWLARVGLARSRPVARGLAGVGFFILGAGLGAIAALALAPTPGAQLRSQVKERAFGLVGRKSAAGVSAQA